MAIYNNREVTIMSEARLQAAQPLNLVVMHQDGSTETVPAGQLRFTKEEKDRLIKQYASAYQDVTVISDDDLKSVRAGVAPSYDPDRKAQAEAQAKTDEAKKLDQKNQDKVQKDVK